MIFRTFCRRLYKDLQFALILALFASVAHSADPQPYKVNLNKTGNTLLDQLLNDASTMISLQNTAPVGPFALIARAKQDHERFITALHSLGYYKAQTMLNIADHSVDDPELFDWLSAAPAANPVSVTVDFKLGPRFTLGKITLQGNLPPKAHDWLKLKTGDPLQAADILEGRERLLKKLRDEGYAKVKVDEPIATLLEATNSVDILFSVDTGPKVVLGEIHVDGLKRLNEAFVKKRLLIAPGQSFKPSTIENACNDLMGLGVFASVRSQEAAQLDAQEREPITFDVVERPLHAVNVGAAYSTDLGGSFSSSWLNRNLLGNAEQLKLSAAVTQLGGNSTTGIGYKAGVAFIKPDFMQRDQSLQIGLNAIKQSLIAYDEKALMFQMTLNRMLAKDWQGSAGIAAQQLLVTQEGISRDYTLLSVPFTLKYDSSNNPLEPTKGIIAAATVNPTQSFSSGGNKPFVLAQVSSSTYLDLGKHGRSVLALRGLVSVSAGASQFELPPDQRYYAGGSATVRGYKYQSIGPTFADSKPQGGTAMSAGSVELRQRILDHYGVVLFADAGQVSIDALPFTSHWQIGAGIGARYYTSFGPIRLDVALPVNPQPGSGSFEVYVSLGQAF